MQFAIKRITSVSLLCAVIMSYGCRSESPIEPSVAVEAQSPRDDFQADAIQERVIQERTRPSAFDIDLAVAGAFSPAAPLSITITVGSKSRSGTANVVLRSPFAQVGEAKRSIMLSKSSSHSSAASLSFTESGYYPIYVSVSAELSESERQQIQDELGPRMSEHRIAWVLIDSNGGRLDRDYDPTVAESDSTRFLAHGSSGAFKSRPAPLHQSFEPFTSASAQSLSSFPVTGVATYFSADSGQRQSIPGASIVGSCKTSSGSQVNVASTTADANGQFLVLCNSGSAYWEGRIVLTSMTANVLGSNGSAVSSNGLAFPYSNITLSVNNDGAARVFLLHERYNLSASTRFQRSRAAVTFHVYTSTVATNYNTSTDRIQIGSDRVWDANGPHVVTHEYGHAFHYVAIDPFFSSSQCPPIHFEHLAYNSMCSYTEGFANFFSAWMRNIDPPFTPGPLTQFNLEVNNYRLDQSINGLLVEARMAAIFLDMVDNAMDNDGISGDDDPMSMSGSQLADIILRCRLWNPNTYRLGHSDQFIYCAENGFTARAAAPSAYQGAFGTYGAITWDSGIPALPVFSDFRANWRYNLYNQ